MAFKAGLCFLRPLDITHSSLAATTAFSLEARSSLSHLSSFLGPPQSWTDTADKAGWSGNRKPRPRRVCPSCRIRPSWSKRMLLVNLFAALEPEGYLVGLAFGPGSGGVGCQEAADPDHHVAAGLQALRDSNWLKTASTIWNDWSRPGRPELRCPHTGADRLPARVPSHRQTRRCLAEGCSSIPSAKA